MGVAFKAFDSKLSRPVVLKTLRHGSADDATLYKRLRREASTMARLRHPNIVELYDYFSEAGSSFIVMEYVEGESLAALTRTNALDVTTIVEAFADLAGALSLVHEAGIFHRDIKPDNIIVSADGVAKFLDFGLAGFAADAAVTAITRTGEVLGTMGYLPPEVVAGQHHDARSDIYELGVSLYYALTGHLPYQTQDLIRLFTGGPVDQPEAPARHRQGIDRHLDHIVLTAMAAAPGKRYRTARLFEEACRAWLQPPPSAPLPGAGADNERPAPGPTRYPPAVLLAGLVCLVAVWLFLPGDSGLAPGPPIGNAGGWGGVLFGQVEDGDCPSRAVTVEVVHGKQTILRTKACHPLLGDHFFYINLAKSDLRGLQFLDIVALDDDVEPPGRVAIGRVPILLAPEHGFTMLVSPVVTCVPPSPAPAVVALTLSFEGDLPDRSKPLMCRRSKGRHSLAALQAAGKAVVDWLDERTCRLCLEVGRPDHCIFESVSEKGAHAYARVHVVEEAKTFAITVEPSRVVTPATGKREVTYAFTVRGGRPQQSLGIVMLSDPQREHWFPLAFIKPKERPAGHWEKTAAGAIYYLPHQIAARTSPGAWVFSVASHDNRVASCPLFVLDTDAHLRLDLFPTTITRPRDSTMTTILMCRANAPPAAPDAALEWGPPLGPPPGLGRRWWHHWGYHTCATPWRLGPQCPEGTYTCRYTDTDGRTVSATLVVEAPAEP